MARPKVVVIRDVLAVRWMNDELDGLWMISCCQVFQRPRVQVFVRTLRDTAVRHFDEVLDLIAIGRGIAVRGETHDLVLALVDLETEEGRQCRVKHAERLRVADFLQLLDRVAVAVVQAGGCPFPDTINGQDRRVLEAGAVICGGGV